MCNICSCVGWIFDMAVTLVTWILGCIVVLVLCIGFSIAIAAGVAYGYNYSVAEFMFTSREDVMFFAKNKALNVNDRDYQPFPTLAPTTTEEKKDDTSTTKNDTKFMRAFEEMWHIDASDEPTIKFKAHRDKTTETSLTEPTTTSEISNIPTLTNSTESDMAPTLTTTTTSDMALNLTNTTISTMAPTWTTPTISTETPTTAVNILNNEATQSGNDIGEVRLEDLFSSKTTVVLTTHPKRTMTYLSRVNKTSSKAKIKQETIITPKTVNILRTGNVSRTTPIENVTTEMYLSDLFPTNTVSITHSPTRSHKPKKSKKKKASKSDLKKSRAKDKVSKSALLNIPDYSEEFGV